MWVIYDHNRHNGSKHCYQSGDRESASPLVPPVHQEAGMTIRNASPVQYRVRVRGHLDSTWTVWFDELTLTQADDGTTELVGPLADQSALYGLLARLRDLGATLLLVEQLA